MGFAIVAAGAISKTDFQNEPSLFQVTQRVINGCVADTGEPASRSLEDVVSGWVIVPLLDHLKNRLPLWRQLGLEFIFLLDVFHREFRLILILRFVNCEGRIERR